MSRELRYKAHSQAVGTWINESTSSLSKEKKIDVFEAALARVLARANTSVSEITLSAVLDRVLYNSAEQYPVLKAIHQEGAKIDFDGIRKDLKTFSDKETVEAFHYLITELFFILGNLTAEQLTPILYRELNPKVKK